MNDYKNFIGIDFPYQKSKIAKVVEIVSYVLAACFVIAIFGDSNILWLAVAGEVVLVGLVISHVLQYLYDLVQLKEYEIYKKEQERKTDQN